MNRPNLIRLTICLALLIFLFTTPIQASACECASFVSIDEEYKTANAVFLGKVIHIGIEYRPITSFLNEIYNTLYPPSPHYYTDMFSGRRIAFAVEKSWKNISTTEVFLRHHDDCGYGYYPFNSGKEYLVYAYQTSNNLESDLNTGFCSRIIEVSDMADDLSYLNTLPTLPLTPVRSYTWLYNIYNIGTTILTLFLYLVINSTRQRKKKY